MIRLIVGCIALAVIALASLVLAAFIIAYRTSRHVTAVPSIAPQPIDGGAWPPDAPHEARFSPLPQRGTGFSVCPAGHRYPTRTAAGCPICATLRHRRP